MDENFGTNWPVRAQAPPNLTSGQWLVANIAGAILIVLALLQLFSFRDFSDNFNALGFGASNVWAGVVIFAELWSAFGFFKIRLSWGFRMVSNRLAVAVGFFWLVNALRQAGQFSDSHIEVGSHSAVVSNFFGRFLTQSSGWWPVIEATVFLFLVIYAVEEIIKKTSYRPVKISRRK